MFSAATKTGSQPSVAANYIEDVFSTWLYTGNGSTQTITNGIDLANKGGLTWIKSRSDAFLNCLFDTNRGGDNRLVSSSTGAQSNSSTFITSFNSNGFSLGSNVQQNSSGSTYASWTFRKQPKFFDVVTYTGTGSNRTISHSLGSVPGMIIVKRTDTTADWQVYHSSLANTEYLVLNTTAAKATGTTRWNSTTPTSSVFSLGTDTTVNASGGTYVAYIYASNAGGFGLTNTDNVISCGSFTSNLDGTIPNINIGYEPQYVLMKNSSTAGENWFLMDVMRNFNQTSLAVLRPNISGAESSYNASPSYLNPTATGFFGNQPGLFTGGATYIYMAIRRPMKVPTDATTVFKPVKQNSINATPTTVSTGFPVDLLITADPSRTYNGNNWDIDRLRGTSTSAFPRLLTNDTTSESALSGSGFGFDNNTGMVDSFWGTRYGASTSIIYWSFARRPGFFDEVCYTGTGSATTFNHNLSVVPELMIVKCRSNAFPWNVYCATLGANKRLRVNTTDAAQNSSDWNSTDPTSSVFSVGSFTGTNGSGQTHVAYLFATCPGVSKVGSYTGTGATQTINCGFTGGARFVLIKRTDDVGDWYVWDTARGMVSGTDPSLLLNSTAAEVNANSVYTATTGFQIVSTAAGINASGGSYIFLAIA